MINLYNMDNMDFMRDKPDNYYELAIVDPEYGLGIDGQKESIKGKKSDRKLHVQKSWDSKIPSQKYFNELFRVSKNQIIWGANYFVSRLSDGHKGWIVWDKGQHGLTMSDCELAYSSFDRPTRIKVMNRCELKKQGTIHPTEKPIKLYEWLLENYAKKGDKIFDSHGGSMSSVIACINMEFNIDCCELDEDYFRGAINRIQAHASQLDMFRKQPKINIHRSK